MEDVRSAADRLGRYIMKHFVEPRLRRSVSFYRATVTGELSNGKLTVQRPMDNPISIPCTANAAGLQKGDQCVVLVLGSESNSIVIGNGTLSGFGGGGGTAPHPVRINIGTDWSGTGPYTQSVDVPGGNANTYVDLRMDAGLSAQMQADRITSMWIENDGGAFTCYALGGRLSEARTVNAMAYQTA